ncbi:hypothetical protein D3C71_960870 [compost metagenome]
MLQALVTTMLSAHDEKFIEGDKFVRTVKIPTLGIGTTHFEITKAQSDEMYAAGLKAGEDFFKEWRPR